MEGATCPIRASCSASSVASATCPFPQPEGGLVTVVYPISFSPGGDDGLADMANKKAESAPPPPPPAPVAAMSAPRNLLSLAAVQVEGGVTRYDLRCPLTIPDHSATMVLILSRQVSGEALYLFAPDGGVGDSSSHPFRVGRFTNATPGMLERGPIAVFEEGAFLGQGMLDPLPAGRTATVPFALERSIAVDVERKYEEPGRAPGEDRERRAHDRARPRDPDALPDEERRRQAGEDPRQAPARRQRGCSSRRPGPRTTWAPVMRWCRRPFPPGATRAGGGRARRGSVRGPTGSGRSRTARSRRTSPTRSPERRRAEADGGVGRSQRHREEARRARRAAAAVERSVAGERGDAAQPEAIEKNKTAEALRAKLTARLGRQRDEAGQHQPADRRARREPGGGGRAVQRGDPGHQRVHTSGGALNRDLQDARSPGTVAPLRRLRR